MVVFASGILVSQKLFFFCSADCQMFSISPFLAYVWRYNHNIKIPLQLSPKGVPSMFSCFHHPCSSSLKSMYHVTVSPIISPNSKIPLVNGYSSYLQFNCTGLFWYSSKSAKPWSRAFRKRVNRRLRLANKPVLNEAHFNKAVAQLPARFTADDLHAVIAVEDDPLVCLELFNWASRQPRFKHCVSTYHITVHKLGVAGMIEEMYDVVNQMLVLPHFGSEALYNTIIYHFTEVRKLGRAITVFKHMKKVKNSDCRPSIKTYNLLFAAFVSRGKNTYINHMYMGTMQSLFRQMVNDGIEPNISTLNLMIQGYVISNHVNDALRIFHQMGVVYSCNPDSLTYDHIIHGLCAQGRSHNARELFSQMNGKGFVASAKTYNSFVNALALGGDVEEALRYFWEMAEKQRPVDFITYKTLLHELCRKGAANMALSLVNEFKEKRLVDGLTYRKLLHVVKDDFAISRNDSCSEQSCSLSLGLPVCP